jgi:anti-sigma regulatory factor (Ser/Thr protein kinase)
LTNPEPDLSASAQERQVGGLGVFMVKQIANAVVYKRESGMNKLLLTLIRATTDSQE